MIFIQFLSRIFVHILHPFLGSIFNLLRPILPARFLHRIRFEEINDIDPYAMSFNSGELRAKACFHVSSEGEFEQVRVLIEHYLELGDRVEIIYSSGSLERKIKKFKQDLGPTKIRVLRLPLLSVTLMNPDKLRYWISAGKIYYCRYDFYPHLVDLARNRTSILLSAALKNKMESIKNNIISKLAFKYVYSQFDHIVAANEKEKGNLVSLGIADWKIDVFDYRIPSILSRLDDATKTLAATNLKSYLAELDAYKGGKIIIGSSWEEELDLLENEDFTKHIINGQIHLCIVPHVDSSAMLALVHEKLKRQGLTLIHLSQNSEITADIIRPGNVILLTHKGILCELYQKFDQALVGCGFKKSVHSVLEPFLAGCSVYCGPKVHRSTEADWIAGLDPSRLSIIQHTDEMANSFKARTFKNMLTPTEFSHKELTSFLYDFNRERL